MKRGAASQRDHQKRSRSIDVETARPDNAHFKSTHPELPESLRAVFLQLEPEPPLPFGWEKCLDMQTGAIYFKDSSTGMSTAEDPRKLQQSRRCVTASLGPAAAGNQDVRAQGWTSNRPRAYDKRHLTGGSIAQEKLSSWRQNVPVPVPELPRLLSLNSGESAPSLELSLRLETPHAREQSTAQPLSEQFPVRYFPGAKETLSAVKAEQQPQGQSQLLQNFLGPNCKMGPFTSTSVQVKEEPGISVKLERTPVMPTTALSLRQLSPAGEKDHTVPVSSIPLNSELQPTFRDFLGLNHNMGPFKAEPMPSSLEQLAGACTLEKVQDALKRSQFRGSKVSAAGSPPAANSGSRCSPQTKDFVPPTSRCVATSNYLPFPTAKLAARSPSPAASDMSPASSSSSRHSSTSPSVMSFQGEELDGPVGGHGSSSDAATPSPPMLLARSTSDLLHSKGPAGVSGGNSNTVLVAVGCKNCMMFVMLSKENPSCPKCGSTGLMEINPTRYANSHRKRQRVEGSIAGSEC